MKFSKLSQLVLVSSIGLLVAISLTACQIITIDYVFVASSAGTGTGSAGQIETFAVDSETGALRLGAPTVSSGGTNPVAMAVSSDFANLYVVNQGSKVVAHFAIASNGVLTSKDTVTTSATPVSVAVNAAGTYLYVVTQSAQLIVYPLSSGAIGTAAAPVTLALPSFAGDTIIPTGVTVLPDSAAVYVSVYDQTAYNPGCTPVAPAITCTPSTANPGWVIGYAVGSGGALTAVPNSPFKAGIKPSSLLADPTGRFMYVTDFASNQVIGYTIGTGGTLNFLLNGPFRTGNEPNALVVEPRGKFLYIANALSNTVTADTIDLATGTPNGSVSAVNSSSTATDTEPVAIAADPALGRFIYTANYLGNTLSGFRIDPDTGTLTTTQATPYPTGNNPTALVIVPHGNHATQVLSQ